MVSYTPPTVGGDANVWGTKLNLALAAIAAAVDANTAAIAALGTTGTATNPVVQNTSVTNITSTTADIDWDAPSTQDNRGAPTGYTVRRQSVQGTSTMFTTTTGMLLGGLTPSMQYTITVSPYFANGTSGGSSTVIFFTSANTGTGGGSGNPPGDGPMPNGDGAYTFTGRNYLEISDHSDFSITTTGSLSVECWFKPSVLNFQYSDNGYIHFMGKGTSGQHEWTCRIYNQSNSESRPNRVSGYAFALAGNLGNGSYWEGGVRQQNYTPPAMNTTDWVHYGLTFNTTNNRIRLYRNGIMTDTDGLTSGYVTITLGNGTAPVKIGTRDGASFFQGMIGKVAFYNTEKTAADFLDHYELMIDQDTGYDAAILAESGLTHYYPIEPGHLTDDQGSQDATAKNA
jgi:hypothetical protein